MHNSTIEKTLNMEKEILSYLKRGQTFYKLPPKLETAYLKSNEQVRHNNFTRLGIIAIFLYNIFLFTDKVMLPDIFPEILFVRLAIATPIMILSVIILQRKRSPFVTDLVGVNTLLLGSISIMYFLIKSQHINVNYYHTGLIIIILLGNTILRLRFQYALIHTLITCVLYIFATRNISQMSPEIAINSILVLCSIATLTLIANFQLENKLRINYLHYLLHKIDVEKLKQLSNMDSLTNLVNRRYFDTHLDKEWRISHRNQQPLSVIFIDIDYFKKYNDHYGHQQGDHCLQLVANKLVTVIKRPRDFIARYGGEEFIALLPNTEEADAMQLAEKMCSEIEELHIEHATSVISKHISISVGVCSNIPENDKQAFQLIKNADRALYQAKKEGRNRVKLYKIVK